MESSDTISFNKQILEDSNGILRLFVGWFAFIVSFISLLLNIPIFLTVLSKTTRHKKKNNFDSPNTTGFANSSHNEQWKMDTLMICIISLLDISLAVVVCVFQFIRFYTDYKIYENGSSYCQIEGLITSCLIHGSLYSVSLLSFERYCIIVLKKRFTNLFYFIILFVVCGLTCFLAFYSAVKNQFILMPCGSYCFLHYGNNVGSIAITIFTIEGFLACTALVYFYLKIMICRRKQNRELQDVINCNKFVSTINNINSGNQIQDKESDEFRLKSNKSRKNDNKVVYRISMIITVYLLCFVPEVYAFIYELFTSLSRPKILDAIAICTIVCTTLGNGILVLALHRQTTIYIKEKIKSSRTIQSIKRMIY